MSDEEEISTLLQSYADRLDAGDLDGVTALFAHSTWRSSGRSEVLSGSDQVRPVYVQLLASMAGAVTTHRLSDVRVDVAPRATTATSGCRWEVLAGTPPTVTLSGRYTDRFEKVDGRWRFADRFIGMDPVPAGSDDPG
jgi:ketosteroid isomerase-like protein